MTDFTCTQAEFAEFKTLTLAKQVEQDARLQRQDEEIATLTSELAASKTREDMLQVCMLMMPHTPDARNRHRLMC